MKVRVRTAYASFFLIFDGLVIIVLFTIKII